MNKTAEVSFFLFIICLCFACSKSNIPELSYEKTDKYLEEILRFGPRVPNSEEYLNFQTYIEKFLTENSAEFSEQDFQYEVTEKDSILYNLKNYVIKLNPDLKNRIMLSAHYDSRPWADKDPNPKNHTTPVLGANDSAVCIALLLSIIEVYQNNPSPYFGLDIVFFDGEDSGTYGSQKEWCLGSKYFAANIGDYKPELSILIDMIGDKNLEIFKDRKSMFYAPELVKKIWNTAEELNISEFKNALYKYDIYDDHIPLNEAGIPTVNIIDFRYKYWHTVNDTKENISVQNTLKVGKVLMKLIYSPYEE